MKYEPDTHTYLDIQQDTLSIKTGGYDMHTTQTEMKATPLNLIQGYKLKKVAKNRTPKTHYNTLISAKGQLSSQQFLTMYALYVLKHKERPAFGKEILDELRSLLNSENWKLSHGTLYPALHRMEMSGLIKQVNEEDRSRNRKFYVITTAGLEYFDENFSEFKRNVASSKKFFNRVMDKLN